jgi:catechol 2,3-dioxygenase-like lactoylglutathione lyase family enzyme
VSVRAVDIGIVSPTDALVAFYEAALDAPRLEPRQFPFATVHRLAVGPVTLKVMVPTEVPAAEAPPSPFWDRAGLRYLTLWLDDLEPLLERWRSAGGTVVLPPTELRPGVVTALLVDPDGNTVEVMQDADA